MGLKTPKVHGFARQIGEPKPSEKKDVKNEYCSHNLIENKGLEIPKTEHPTISLKTKGLSLKATIYLKTNGLVA
jgi:hypothetical protein